MELEHLNYVNKSVGQTINLQEQSNLEIGLVKRQATEDFMSIQFWGRIEGTENDYLIVKGILSSEDYPIKKFFFSTKNSPELQQFPELSEVKREKAAKISPLERLSGDPSLPLEEIQDVEEGKPGQDTFREVDRLLFMVEAIEREVSIVPCGAYVMASSHSVIQNKNFEGLSWEKSKQLESYYHFRYPEEPERCEVLKSDGLVRPSDFLDCITSDTQGSWNIMTDNTETAVILRSLVYPGYVFFHKPRTGIYGSAYFGDGIKNSDLVFMV